MIKTYGCSYTRYKWPTWADFLKISYKKLENYGMPGNANTFIAKTIKQTASSGDKIIVMWSSFNRVHNEKLYKIKGHGEGVYTGKKFSLEYLWNQSIKSIYETNTFCKKNNITIYNLSAFVFEMGETKKVNKFKIKYDVNFSKWPQDLSSFCYENPSNEKENDLHPTPSQHYQYCKKVVGPYIGVKIKPIKKNYLIKLNKIGVSVSKK